MTTVFRHQIDLRALPGAYETIAYKDGGLFPVLTQAPNGGLIAVLRGGAGHLGLPGRIEVIRSADAGRTWSPPQVIADSDRDDRNPAFGLSPQGTLVLSYHCQGNYDENGVYIHNGADPMRVDAMVTRSHDGGLTWEMPFPLGVEALQHASPYGKIVALPAADGPATLIMPIYHSTGSYIVRSQDDGATWGDPSLLHAKMNETTVIVLPNGELLAAMRGADQEQALHLTRSSDGGYTWSPAVQLTGARQHPADIIALRNGALLLTYGNRNPPYRIEGLVSRDGGHTWLDCLLAFSGNLYGYNVDAPRRSDLGYPSSMILPGGQGVTLYYYNPSINKPINWGAPDKEPLHLARDYYAIAISWDEAALLERLDQLA
ncbi:MAG: exo-alpha-sialidase [Caldilineaceae bacterium]|nr:exo-alpha-sialidase [Caldilineaceae bacterium]